MKVRDIVKLSATMLGLDELLDGSKIYDETFDIEKEYNEITEGAVKSSEEKTLELLTRCFNLVYKEIATDYIPLAIVENIEVSGGSFSLSKLDKDFYKLCRLENKFGIEVKCEIYDNVLYVKDGNYRIVYCYKPEFATLNSEVSDFNGKLTDRVLALGLNKEYCYVSGEYDQSGVYKSKFEESLECAMRARKNIVMPRRRWL